MVLFLIVQRMQKYIAGIVHENFAYRFTYRHKTI